MKTNEAKKMNQKYVNFQKDFNKGWKIGPITVIVMIALLIMFVYFLSNL